MAPNPVSAAVLCRQFPTAIHLDVSSPSFEGSITIKVHSASSALSSSYSNVSCAFSLSYTSRMMATLADSSLHKKKISKFPSEFSQEKKRKKMS